MGILGAQPVAKNHEYMFRSGSIAEPTPFTTRIAIKTNKRIVLVDSDGLISVRAQGRNVAVDLKSGSHVLRALISNVAKQLEPYGFIRIHRSALVNGLWVNEISPHFDGEYRVLLRDGRELKVARAYKNNLVRLAVMWF